MNGINGTWDMLFISIFLFAKKIKRAQASAAAGHALSLQQAIYFRKTCFIQNASGSRISLRISAPSVSRKQTRSPFTASAAAMPAASPIERQIG